MLQHLWTGPISNASVDVVQGSRSVEVRAVGVTKVTWFHVILVFKLSECLCCTTLQMVYTLPILQFLLHAGSGNWSDIGRDSSQSIHFYSNRLRPMPWTFSRQGIVFFSTWIHVELFLHVSVMLFQKHEVKREFMTSRVILQYSI